MWRLRRRAAGRCTGPYVGAAVGAMCGPCRRRASGDAAVARVVVWTDARPLVRIWTRGGVLWCVHDVFDVRAVDIVIRWAAELRRMAVSWPWLRRHGDDAWWTFGCPLGDVPRWEL